MSTDHAEKGTIRELTPDDETRARRIAYDRYAGMQADDCEMSALIAVLELWTRVIQPAGDERPEFLEHARIIVKTVLDDAPRALRMASDILPIHCDFCGVARESVDLIVDDGEFVCDECAGLTPAHI